MTQIDEKAFKETLELCLSQDRATHSFVRTIITRYEAAKAPRTISSEELIASLEKEIVEIPEGEECAMRGASKYNWGRYWLQRVKHLATLGITVGD